MTVAAFFWLIPLLPLAAFALLAVGLSCFRRWAAGLAVAAVAAAVIISAIALVAATRGTRAIAAAPWLAVGGRRLEFALWLDPLSALTALLVAIVGLIVLLYSLCYMAGDPRFGRFFTELALFIGAMLSLVLAGDLITLFIAWELVGLASYLLIGFWFERPDVPAAATKAFLTTRLADLTMLLGVLLLIGAAGTGRIDTILAAAMSGKLAAGLVLLSALLLTIGAAGKSAQFPFQGWLPDAMLGPTPVSALLHSATMVAAGVFLIARLYPLFQASPPALTVVAWGGALTALLGASLALGQRDLKRLLAYSTISQIGLMFLGLGAGSLLAGMLLLICHALYKSTLFLGAGAVDHAVEGTEFAQMGGLARRMPWTFGAFLLAAIALAGLPVTLALPPKDPALAAAWQANAALLALGLLASLFTALYSARAVGLVFLGEPSEAAWQAHEAAPGLLAPMLALVVLIFLGLLIDSALAGRPLEQMLGGPTPESGLTTVLALTIAALGLALGLAARLTWPAWLFWPGLDRLVPLLAGEYGFRWLYHTTARLGMQASKALAVVDRAVFDAFAGWMAVLMLKLVRTSGRVDLGGIDASIRLSGQALLAVSQRLRTLQTGMIGNYLLAMALWGLGVLVVAVVVLALR